VFLKGYFINNNNNNNALVYGYLNIFKPTEDTGFNLSTTLLTATVENNQLM
jgi:hypothetical protein